MKFLRILGISLITSILTLSSVTLSQASSTYTQGWAGGGPADIASVTSATTWESVSTGRVSGPSNKMTFIVPAGTQTVRMAISVNAGAYDTSSVVGCAWRAADGTGTTTSATIGTGTSQATLAFVSKTSTEVVCDLTMGADFADKGFELYTGTLGYWASNASPLTSQVAFISVSRSSTGSSSGGTTTTQPAAQYTGPKITSFDRLTVSPGGTLIASGKKLDQIWSATINGEVATLSYTDDSLEVSIPAGLAPGKYNLEMQTAYGKLTYLGAILVKAKPVLASFTLKSSASQVSLDLADELRSIGSMFSSDYSKIHCVVNTSHPDAADIAAEVCGVLKTGSLASAKTLISTKSTYQGSGFWVKVYLAG